MVTGSPGRKLWRLGGIDHGKAVSLSANAGEDSARLTPILDGSLTALCLFLRAGLLLHLVQGDSGILRRNCPRELCPPVDGMPDRPPDDRDPAYAVLRLECGELRQRLCYRWLPAVSHLGEHDAEGEADPHPGPLRGQLRRHGYGRSDH